MKNTSEVCVPVSALALPSEQEGGQGTAPTQGDTVDISGTGKVTRIEGEKAYVALETVNGQPVDSGEPKAEKSLDDEEDELRRDAAKAGPQVY